MLVYHSQAARLLKEFGDDGVPGFEHIKVKLGSADKNDLAELTVVDSPHTSEQAFANAAGIVAASPVPAEVKCLTKPSILGFANVGQIVTANAGVWEELEPSEGAPVAEPSTTLRWLYDGDEETPVLIREDNGLGPDSLTIPADALGKTIVLRVSHGGTTVLSAPFGPVKDGLTEYPYEEAEPVLDVDIVKAESAKAEAKKTTAKKRASKAKASRKRAAVKK